MKELGEYLKHTRVSNGVSLAEAAEDLELSTSQLENIESGNVRAFKDVYNLKQYVKQYAKYLGLNPEKVVFMMDKGLEIENIRRNIIALKTYGKMKEFTIQFWKPGDDVPSKASPSDLGKNRFEKALREELIEFEESN